MTSIPPGEWVALFEALSPAQPETSPGRSFSVARIREEVVRLGKDPAGRAAFLVQLETPAERPALSVDLPNFQALHNCRVTLFDEAGVGHDETLSILACRSDDPALQSLFIWGVGHALWTDTTRITQETLELLVQHLLELFRASEAPPTGTVSGLWGELFVICEAQNSAEWVAAWHSDPKERFDFSTAHERIEVKTTVSPTRHHPVSLEQLSDPAERPRSVQQDTTLCRSNSSAIQPNGPRT